MQYDVLVVLMCRVWYLEAKVLTTKLSKNGDWVNEQMMAAEWELYF